MDDMKPAFLWQVKKSQKLPIDVVICHLREYQFVTPCDLKLELKMKKAGKWRICMREKPASINVDYWLVP